MNKFMCLFFYIVIVFAYYYNLHNCSFYEVFKNYDNASFCFVVSKESFENENSKIRQVFNSMKIQTNGSKVFLNFKSLNKKIKFDEVDYFQVKFVLRNNNVFDIFEKLKIQELFFEKFEDKKIYYGYSSFYKKFVNLKNKKINFQFIVDNNYVTVGYPFVYGSY